MSPARKHAKRRSASREDRQMANIRILNEEYKLATGPNGNVYVTVKRKPHLCYSVRAAMILGLIEIEAA
jgi:hypothetical protein